MKLSIEAKVAAAIAIAFAALSIGAIAQEQSETWNRRAEPDESGRFRDFLVRPERKQREPTARSILIGL